MSTLLIQRKCSLCGIEKDEDLDDFRARYNNVEDLHIFVAD